MFQRQEYLIVPNIVFLVIVMRCQRQTHRTRREILECTPDAGHHKQALVGSVQGIGELVDTVIDSHVKTAADGNDKLMTSIVAVSAAFGSTRHIINIECALNVKRKLYPVVHSSEVAVGVVMTVQRDDAAVVDLRLVVDADSIVIIPFFHILRF